jgi:hypothetical protein
MRGEEGKGPKGIAQVQVPNKDKQLQSPYLKTFYGASLVGRYDNPILFVIPARHATLAGGIDSKESIPGPLKRLQIRALNPPLATAVPDPLTVL